MSQGESNLPRKSAPGEWILITLILAGYFGLLLVTTAARVRFPWDVLIWSESPFLTNMLKLHQGVPLFTAPDQVNSFVYAPGLDLLAYSLLSPFGLETDIRWCRAVNVGVGLLAAMLLALAAYRISSSTDQPPRAWGVLPTFFFLFSLVVFANFTADIPHPDNLHILHVSLTFLVAQQALASRSLRWALLAVVIAGIGVWSKQVAAGAVFGVLGAFVVSRTWNAKTSALLVLVGLSTFAVSLSVLLFPDLQRFYLLELLSKHTVEPGKSWYLLKDVLLTPYRALLVLGAALALWRYWLPSQSLRPLLLLWAALGITEVFPAVLAYLKVFGLWNNLVIIDVWLLLLLATALQTFIFRRNLPEETPTAAPARGVAKFLRKYGWLVYTLLLTGALVPQKKAPDAGLWRYGNALQEAVAADEQAGRRVLVSHGAMFRILAGNLEVPLDRANSMLELRAGGKANLAGTDRRITDHVYDRVYLNSTWYGDETVDHILRTYRTVGHIPGPQPVAADDPRWWRDLRGGLQRDIAVEVIILEPPE